MKKTLISLCAMFAFTLPLCAAFIDAVEMTGGEFVSSGDADWYECYDDSYEGDSCIRSGSVYYYDESNLKLTVNMSNDGTVSFRWKQMGVGSISFSIDGSYRYLRADGGGTWNLFTTELAAGSHTFNWYYQAGYTWDANGIYLDKIAIPGYEVIDPDTQDPDNTMWTTTDKKLFRSGIVGNGKYSYKTMTVEGKGVLSFKWRTSSEKYFDRLSVTFDGSDIVPAISGETEWARVVYTNELDGAHTVRWRYSKDCDTTVGNDGGYVKDIRWGDGTIPFEYDSTAGVYRSGAIDDNEQSEAELWVTGVSDYYVRWKVSSQEDGDFLSCYVDGVPKSAICGEEDWEWLDFYGSGWNTSTHKVKFVYSKDATGTAGEDCGYIKPSSNGLLAWRVNGLEPSVGSGSWTHADGYYLSAASSSSILPMTVSSNGKISFQFRAYDSQDGYLSLYVDGVCVKSLWVQGMYNSEYEYWNSATYTIKEPGAHLIEWRASGRVCLKLDDYTGTRTPWVVDKRDYVNAQPDDVGDKGWVASAVENYQGYRSGKIGAGQTSRITARVGYTSYGDIRFYWKNSGSHAGTLNFYVNGELQSSLKGASDNLEEYSDYGLSLYNNENTLVWEYVNGDDAVSGEDFGWIGDISWNDWMYGTSLEWGTLSLDAEEETSDKPATTFVWTTVTNSDESVTLTSVTPTPSGSVRLPATVDGRAVTSIGRKVFGENRWYNPICVTYVVIPEGVVNIEDSAFDGLEELRGVELPSTLKTIGNYAFESTGITAVKIPEGVTTIGKGAFSGSPVEIVLLPSTLKELAISWEYKSLGKVYEDEMTINPFYGCAADCTFSFPRGNANYSVVNGHIISSDGILISGSVSGGTAAIPSSVTAIGSYAFRDCDALRSIYIPGTVKSICCKAFYGSGLVSAHLDSGVEDVRYAAFEECSRLSSVVLSEGLKLVNGMAFGNTPIKQLEIPSTVTNFYNAASGMTNLVSLTFKGAAPNCLGDYNWFWDDVPASCVVNVKKGTKGWDGDSLSAELPSSGYWPYSGSYGRPIQWYGDTPAEWTSGWWNDGTMSYEKSDDGWTMLNGVCKSAEWKAASYSSGGHTNYVEFAFSGGGIFACDIKFFGRSQYDYAYVLIDGVEMPSIGASGSSYSSPSWRHLEYAVGGEGQHVVRVEYRIANNFGYSYGATAYLQNVNWTPKSNWARLDYVWETVDNGDGTVTVVDVSPSPMYDMFVPAEVGGKRVTGIGESKSSYAEGKLFYANTLVTSVVLPEGLEKIGQSCFSRCYCLKSITVPTTVTNILDSAFSSCYSLSSVEIPEGISRLESDTFYSCKTLRAIEIPASVTCIDREVFSYCRSLEQVVFYGDCPKLYDSPNAYSGMLYNVPSTCTVAVMPGTTGWGDIDIPGTWYGFPITYMPSVPHKVSFDANGGVCEIWEKTVYENSVYSDLPTPTNSNPRLAFDGWYTAKMGGDRVTSSNRVKVTANQTLYAHWKTALYKVTVTTTHGTAMGGEYEYGTVVTLKAPEPVVEGTIKYICLGSSMFPGEGTEVQFTVGNSDVSGCWDQWRTQYYVTVETPDNGRLEGAVSGWYDEGTELRFRAVADSGYRVERWTGDLRTVVVDVDTAADIVRSGHSIGVNFAQGSATPKKDGGPYVEAVDGVEWSYRISGGKAVVTGASASNSLDIPCLLGNCQVVEIANGAFQNRSGNVVVTIPNSVTNIGEGAFYQVSLSVQSFPRNLKRIGSRAFYGCNMSGVQIEAQDLVIGEYAFYFTDTPRISQSSATVQLTGSGIKIGNYAFANYEHGYGIELDLTGVSEIGEYAFNYAGYLSAYRYSDDGLYDIGSVTVKISEQMRQAATNAFNWAAVGRVYVDRMETILDLPGWLDFMSQRTSSGSPYEGFWCLLYIGGERIDTLDIPEGVETIPNRAFYGIRLKHVNIPASVKTIGEKAFGSCRATFSFAGDPPICGDRAFSSCTAGSYSAGSTAWTSAVSDSQWNGLLMSSGNILDYSSALNIALPFVNEGWYAEWFAQSKETHDGHRAMRTNTDIRNGTSLACEIVGPAEVSFWWKVERNGYSGVGLSCRIDDDYSSGVAIGSRSAWEKATVSVPRGAHKVSWHYSGAGSNYRNYGDYALLDEVEVMYDVTFDPGEYGERVGGGALEQKVRHGEPITPPELRVAEGYRFVGWSRDISSASAGGTYAALYKEGFPDGGPYKKAVDGVEWTFMVKNGEVQVNQASPSTGAVVIPEKLGGCPVTGVANYAFYGCSSVTNVTMPESVMNIGSGTFYGCSGLKNVTMPECVTNLGMGVFYGCSALTNVTIPSGSRSIGDYMFYGCSNLTRVTIPEDVTSIGYCAFYDCVDLTSVAVPLGVTSIGDYAFCNCVKLSDLAIAEGLTRVGSYAFYGCNSLTCVAMPDGMTSIGDCAFYGCGALTGINIPRSVTSIGAYAFYGCSKLGSGVVIVDDCVLTVNGTYYISQSLPSGVRLIAGGAFYDCDAMTDITIPEGVTSIGPESFYGCGKLALVIHQGNAPEVGEDAFKGVADGCVLMAYDGTTGWNDDDDWKWQGLTLVYRLRDASAVGDPGATNVLWRTGGDAPWVTRNTREGWVVRSGAIGKNSETWVECVVTNGCRVAFDWTTSCEEGEDGEMFDFLSFSVDGDEMAAICGEMGFWTNEVFEVFGEGEHVLRWTYQKDRRTDKGNDCGWIRKVRVDPEVSVTFDANGATLGEVPEVPMVYFGDTIDVPDQGTLVRSRHTFGGWRHGETTYQDGEELLLETNAVAFVAVWDAKVLNAPMLVTPEEPHVLSEKILVTLQVPANAQGIRYTLDGTEPTAASAVYVGPFEIEDMAKTVKAVAFADDWFDSACATWNLSRAPWTAAECLNAESYDFSFGGNADWVRDLNETHDGEAAMRSGVIGRKQESSIRMIATGAGTVSFWCKVSSEYDLFDGEAYDGLAISVDGKDVYDYLIGGEVGWTNITVAVSGAGEHVISWRYEKDKTDDAGEDCAWLDGVTWTLEEEPLVELGGTTDYSPVGWTKPIAVSNDWLIANGLVKPGDSATEAQVKLTETGANGLKRYESYILGMEPDSVESAEEQLKVTIEGFDDEGLPIIKYSPKPNDAARVKYTTLGKSDLKAVDWVEVTDLNKYLMRFYRTKAEIVP